MLYPGTLRSSQKVSKLFCYSCKTFLWKSGVMWRSNYLVDNKRDRVALVGPWYPAKVKPPELYISVWAIIIRNVKRNLFLLQYSKIKMPWTHSTGRNTAWCEFKRSFSVSCCYICNHLSTDAFSKRCTYKWLNSLKIFAKIFHNNSSENDTIQLLKDGTLSLTCLTVRFAT